MNSKFGKHLFILLFLCIAYKSRGQMTILPVFGDKPITEDTWFVSKNGDSIQLNTVRFYMSNIQYVVPDVIFGKVYFKASKKAHLIDIFDPTTLKIELSKIDLKQVKSLYFNIGIDSLTNVSGALDGDLDPQRGMYWAWQSGYINMKIEGKSPQSKNRKNVFQYHIGGYLQPFYAMKEVELPINAQNTSDVGFGMSDVGKIPKSDIPNPKSDIPNPKYTEGVILKIDVSKFFEKIHIATQNSIMMPCEAAMQLADYSVSMFSIQAQ